ncbi:cytochrome P450 52A1 [Dactylonectria estremocensis]|uniref:Cytochrome P450 52A1 n=1 Tax=Dactylonectria estremocensis TaxID=1079267 RepID=A0A9P9DGV2_9HYPO|nr:cytochrome P450 52A1 [Dactylonectria estremocensis]
MTIAHGGLNGSGFLRHVLITLVILFVVSKVRSWYIHRRRCSSNGCLPPPAYPHRDGILGLRHLRSLIKARREKRLPTAFSSIFTDTGANVHTVTYSTLGSKTYWTIDADNIKAVLSSKFNDWGLPQARIAAFAACWGGGIFGADGAEWEHSRAMLRPSFNRRQGQDTELLEKHIQNLLTRIPHGKTVDLAELIPLLTMDIATELLFGESAGCLDPAKSVQGMEFTSAFNYVMQKMSVQVSFPLLANIPDRRLKSSVKCINDFTDAFVTRALCLRDKISKAKTPGNEDNEGGRSKKYVFLDELAKGDYSPMRLRAELLSVMVAGRDTTASLLSIIWWHLARRPDIVRKLRKEIAPLESKPPSSNELKSMTYLRNVINEVLRLYPINPINSRVAVRDTTLPRGGGKDGLSPVFIGKGQRLIFSSSALHRRKDIYGQDAMQLRPERWDTLRQSTWEYIPFGGGPRVCIGQQLAQTEAAYTTVRLLQEFERVEPRSEGPFQEGFAMALSSGDGCRG